MGVSRENLLGLSVEDLLTRVATSRAEPGAGAVAAVCASLAAALLAMAAEAARDSWEEAGGAAAQAEALRRRTGALAGENAGAYDAALELLARPRGEGEGDRALGEALEAAASVPLGIAGQAGAIAELAAEVAANGRAELQADAIAAAGIAAAATRTAALLVEVNLAVGPEDERASRARALSASAQGAAERALDTRD